jgi:hypothetical protein
MRDNDVLEKGTMDKSGANKAAIAQIIDDKELRSRIGRASTSTISSSRAIVQSSASANRCWSFTRSPSRPKIPHFSAPIPISNVTKRPGGN